MFNREIIFFHQIIIRIEFNIIFVEGGFSLEKIIKRRTLYKFGISKGPQ